MRLEWKEVLPRENEEELFLIINEFLQDLKLTLNQFLKKENLILFQNTGTFLLTIVRRLFHGVNFMQRYVEILTSQSEKERVIENVFQGTTDMNAEHEGTYENYQGYQRKQFMDNIKFSNNVDNMFFQMRQEEIAEAFYAACHIP